MRRSLLAGVAASCLLAAGCETIDTAARDIDESAEETSTQIKIDDSFEAAAKKSEAAGEWLNAAGYWQSLLDREPTNLDAAIGLAENLRRMEQYDHAVDVLRSAMTHRPDDPRLLGLYGRTLVQAGNAAAAIDPLEKAIAQDSGQWETYSALGVAYAIVGEPARANEANLRALALSPGNPKVMNNMGLEAAMDGNLDAAIDFLERAAASDEADITVRQNLALLLAYRGDLVRAEQLTRQDLPPDLADRNVAFYQSLSGDDLDNFEDLMNPSSSIIEQDSLTVIEQVAQVEVVVPEEEIVEPAEEIVASASVTPDEEVVTEEEVVIEEEVPAPVAVAVPEPEPEPELAEPEPEPVQVSNDDGALAPTRVSASVDEIVRLEDQEGYVLELLGSITAPAPEAGDIAVITDDGDTPAQRRSSARNDEVPTGSALDLGYFESALTRDDEIHVQGDAEAE